MLTQYTHIDQQVLNLIKYPPLYPPVVNYGEDVRYSSNNLRGKLFQFCYRYTYAGYMQSVFCPYSKLLIPQGEELPNGDFLPNFTINNYIAVKISMGHYTVNEVEIAFRHGNAGTLYVYDRIKRFEKKGITGTLYLNSNKMDNIGVDGGYTIDELQEGMIIRTAGPSAYAINNMFIISIDVENNSIYLNAIPTYSIPIPNYTISNAYIDDQNIYSIFRNNRVNYPVASEDAIAIQDNVPLTAEAIEVIESNRIVAANVKSGFDNVDVSIESIITNEIKADLLSKFDFPKEYSALGTGLTKYAYIMFPTTLTKGQFYYISAKFTETGGSQPQRVASYYVYEATENVEDVVAYIIETFDKYNPEGNVQQQYHVKTVWDHVYSDWTYFQYDNSRSYHNGQTAVYVNRIYIAKTSTSNHSPTGTDNDNVQWMFLCSVVNSKMAIMFYTSSDAPGFTGDLYTLISLESSIYTSQNIYQTLKFGSKINIGIEYVQEPGRVGSVNKTFKTTIDLPALSSLNGTTFPSNAIVNKIKLNIKNRPPDWANAYRIMIDKRAPWFFDFFFYGFSHTSPDIIDDNTHYKINVNRSIQNLRDYLPKAILNPYTFVKGDRIRLIAYKRTIDITRSTNNQWRKFNVVLDSEIIGYDYAEIGETYLMDAGNGTPDSQDYILDSSGNKVRDISTGRIIIEKFGEVNIPFDNAVYVLYQIYRPSKIEEENNEYHEIATYGIGNPGQDDRFHMGDVNQDPDNLATTPAEVTLDFGNCYRKMRYSGEADIYFPVESMHLSDFYESNSISIGRVNTVSEDLGQVTEENAGVYSDKLLEGTKINRLNKFPASHKFLLSKMDGPIFGLIEKGFILYAIQDRQVTSLYIGREVLMSPDGTENVTILKDRVFGTMRPMQSQFGCSDYSSICESDVHVYFKDSQTGKICRIAYNGIFPVSDYGKSGEFNIINNAYRASSNKSVFFAYDRRREELLCTFRYQDSEDLDLTFSGDIANGSNAITGIGSYGDSKIEELYEGMIISEMSPLDDTKPDNLTISRVDVANKIVYLDSAISFDTGVIASPAQISAHVIKKFNQVTWVFHEPANAWKTRMTFIPECYGSYGDRIFSFLHGTAWGHESIISVNNFYGVQFGQYIQFVYNAEAEMIKTWQGIEMLSNKKWAITDKGDLMVLTNDARGVEMESKLPAVRFRNVEGKYVAAFLRDMNTPGFTNEVYALNNGRFLKGQAVTIKLSNFETQKVILYEVVLYFMPS